MKIAITGASGFIGSEIIRELQRIPNTEVIAFTRNRKKDNAGNVTWVETDYTKESLIIGLCGTDAVIHLAAIRGTSGSIADYQQNEVLTENVLLAMKEAKVKKIVFASSIAVYSNQDTIPWKAQEVLSPKTLYGITKAACEHLCAYYSKLYGYQAVILRIAQVLGLGEKRKAMMNVFIDTAREKGQIKVMGRSIAKRQYIYVKDLARIFALIAVTDLKESGVYPVGMEKGYTNLEIAQEVNQAFENATPIVYDDSFPETIESSIMDCSKIRKLLSIEMLDMKEALLDMRKELNADYDCQLKRIMI